MYFSNKRQIESFNNNSNINMINMFHTQINRISTNQGIINKNKQEVSNIQIPLPVKVDIPQKKSMTWGEPTWFMFHTLAHKVNDNTFSIVRKDLINIIYTICNNLPCPDCAKHATEYMNNINFNTIQTKEQLKNTMFIFHNTVNKNKGFSIFPIDDLDSKYSQANTLNIIRNFMVHFENKHKSLRMISDDMHRARISNNLKDWFNTHIKYFDM